MRRDPARVRDTGAGSVLAVGVLGAVTALAVSAAAASSLLVERAVAAGAADSAALASADVAAGFGTGPPCAAASEIASASGTHVVSCDVTGTTVSVRVESASGLLRIPVQARARAGQPPDPPPG